jgi:hypothetical protein
MESLEEAVVEFSMEVSEENLFPWPQRPDHYKESHRQKSEGSFISIQRASMSTPELGLKKIANSLSQWAVIFALNQSGNAVMPGHTTPSHMDPLVLFRKMLSSTPRSKGGYCWYVTAGSTIKT